MDGYQYEKRCAQYLDKEGYTDIAVTPSSGDQGIDIIAYKEGKKYGIQCKYYTGTVGNKAIQEAYAGAAFYSCDVAMVITNATFSKPATTLAEKLGVELQDGVDAIALFESSLSATISDEDSERTEIERLEKLLLSQYQALKAKFPENGAKTQEIAAYTEEIISEVSELMQQLEERSNSIYCQMLLENFNSSRDPKFLDYKRKLKDNCLFYDKIIKERFEAADKYASHCVSAGVSEAAALDLINMISHIYNEGGFSVKINSQTVVESKWTARHTRIYEKWMAFKEELPSTIQLRDKEAEKTELRYAKENLANTRKKIKRLQENLKVAEEKNTNETNDLTAKEKKLTEFKQRCTAANNRIADEKRVCAAEVLPLMEKQNEINRQLTELINNRESLQQKMNGATFFAIGQKKKLRVSISEFTIRIDSLSHLRSDLDEQIKEIKEKHEQIIAKLEEESQNILNEQKKLVQEIDRLKRRLQNRTSEKEIQQLKQELKALKETLPGLNEKVKNAHRFFLEKRLQERL